MKRVSIGPVMLTAITCFAVASFDRASGESIFGRPHSCAHWQGSNSGVEGITTIAFLVTQEGAVADPRVIAPSGDEKQDAASLQCVRTWRYRPAVRDGMPVESPWKADIAWNASLPPVLTERLGECARSLRAQSS